ncbi:cell division control protein [Gonapodya sp. JEL0774]|nr:cell division control protein [Gonapodya sp. JEL0774]
MAAPAPPAPAPAPAGPPGLKKIPLTDYVGFDTILRQNERKFLQQGFRFNLMLVGPTGSGKTTLVNTLYAAHVMEDQGPRSAADVKSTTEIQAVTHLLEENSVRLRLTIIDTPGFGDQVNNDACWDAIVRYVKEQYAAFLRRELTPQREKRIPDTRVHCVLYFIEPSGHALRPIDITVLRALSSICNVVPVISKADSLTLAERESFKERVRKELDFNGIEYYPKGRTAKKVVGVDVEGWEGDIGEEEEDKVVAAIVPFAIVGSEQLVSVGGKMVRGRKTKWGTINVEDPTHCEFPHLRQFLTRTHLQDLIDTTAMVHYEAFRTRQLLALKEGGKA